MEPQPNARPRPLDASVAKGFASLDRIQAGKEVVVRILAPTPTRRYADTPIRHFMVAAPPLWSLWRNSPPRLILVLK